MKIGASGGAHLELNATSGYECECKRGVWYVPEIHLCVVLSKRVTESVIGTTGNRKRVQKPKMHLNESDVIRFMIQIIINCHDYPNTSCHL